MICFHCGKRLTDAMGRRTGGVSREFHGTAIRLHKDCAAAHDKAHGSLSARAATSDSGRTYYDDQQRASTGGDVYRLVYAKPGDEP